MFLGQGGGGVVPESQLESYVTRGYYRRILSDRSTPAEWVWKGGTST